MARLPISGRPAPPLELKRPHRAAGRMRDVGGDPPSLFPPCGAGSGRRCPDEGSAHTAFALPALLRICKIGASFEIAQQMAGHESARTTGLYDRRNDSVALDEVERIDDFCYLRNADDGPLVKVSSLAGKNSFRQQDCPADPVLWRPTGQVLVQPEASFLRYSIKSRPKSLIWHVTQVLPKYPVVVPLS